jgi:hypothetical protein
VNTDMYYVRTTPKRHERGVDESRVMRMLETGGVLDPVEQTWAERNRPRQFARWCKQKGII